MINVTEAKDIIERNCIKLAPVLLPVIEASGYVLAADIFAEFDIPSFDQSSMDGYAIAFNGSENPFKVNGEMAAGSTADLQVNYGEAARIFTGAPLPKNTDTVVMQEKVQLLNNTIVITDTTLAKGLNVRLKGAEVKAGALAMQKGGLLSPAAIGFLAGIGVTEVLVYALPVVSIIVTGNELQKPGNPLLPGQVYESNSYSLTTALQQAGIKIIKVFYAADNLNELKNTLQTALENSDIVLLTGGVSVGDYDFVVRAAELCSIKQQFHKIKQKPGKPLYFGKLGNKLIFGLPGNPASVLNCYYNYVVLALQLLSGKNGGLQKVEATLTKSYAKLPGLTHFLKGAYLDGKATPLTAQESFKLNSFALADCLICLEEAHADYIEGETVTVYLLPH